jgi:alkylhydroperoxidase/carboxymuconolactone decarboxylase family protein YurZ
MDRDEGQAAESVDGRNRAETVEILAAPTRSLVAIGAASALNCARCLRHLIPAALENGILPEEVAAALAVAREVRTRTGASTDNLAAALIMGGETSPDGTEHDRASFRSADHGPVPE